MELEPDRAIVKVTSSSCVSSPLSYYRATLAANDVTIAELRPVADRARDESLSFEDAFGDGRMSAVDRFIVSPLPPGRYTLSLFCDDCPAGTQTWTVE